MRQKKPMKKEETRSEVNTGPTLGQSILVGVFQGFTFGSGSAVAHNIFRTKQEVKEENQKCKFLLETYNKVCSTNNLLENQYIQKDCSELFKEINDICYSFLKP